MMLKPLKITIYLVLTFFSIGCISEMKHNNEQFTWGAQRSGPKGYPMEMLKGVLYFKDEDKGLSIPSGSSDGEWGRGIANHPHIKQHLPDKLKLTFYSYAENQAYQGEFNLPYDKLVELFNWGVDNPKMMGDESFPIFSKFVVGISPGGSVALWIKGHGEQREVFFGQADKIDISLSSVFDVPFRTEAEAENFRLEVLREDVGEEQFNNIVKNSAPFDIWQRYRKPYHWVIQTGMALGISDIYADHINGEHFNNKTDYSLEHFSSIPSFINFYFGPKLYEVELDDYETIAAFERINAIEGLTPEERMIHIEVTPLIPKNTSSVRIFNAKQSILLEKAVFTP